MLARRKALVGLSFNMFKNLYDVREGLKARGHKSISKSAVTIRNMLIECSKIIKNNLKIKVSVSHLTNGHLFVIGAT